MAPLLKATPLNNVPGSGLLFTLLGIGFGLLFAWIFFEAIYIVVPNQHISFRNSWMGAVVAAVAKVYPYKGAGRDRTGFRHRAFAPAQREMRKNFRTSASRVEEKIQPK